MRKFTDATTDYRGLRNAAVFILVAGLISACAERQPEPVAAPATTAVVPAAEPPPIPPMPAGYDYPAGPALEAAIAKGDSARLREHGWWLWAALNSTTADGKPLWWSWPTSTQAFAGPDTRSAAPQVAADDAAARKAKHMIAANVSNTPINLPAPWYPVPTVDGNKCSTGSSDNLPDGDRFQANGDVMIAGVIYDASAYQWIRSQNLYQASTLTTQWNRGQGARQIAPFPSTAIVLKHMYWPAKGDDLTALPVWDPDAYPPLPAAYVGYERWRRIVVIDPSGKPVPAGLTGVANYLFHAFENDRTTPLGPILKTGKVVSINDFYHHRVSAAELDALGPNDRQILNASACWLYNRPFQAGDLLVSVAMHVITREIDRWALQSLWWHDQPNAGPFAANRPAISPQQAPGPWNHYLLTIEYGLQSAPGMLPVSFNPFIELAAAHPIQTNCRNCHIRAAWPNKTSSVSPPASIASSYEADGGPGALADLKLDDPIFSQLLLVDFQWAVSDRAH